MTGAGGQEHRQPRRRANVSELGLRQLSRHTGHVRLNCAKGGGDAGEDECVEARRVLLRLRVEKRNIETLSCRASVRYIGVPLLNAHGECVPEPLAPVGGVIGYRGQQLGVRRSSLSPTSKPKLSRGRWATVTDEAGYLHRFCRLGGSGILGHLLDRRRLLRLSLLHLLGHGQLCSHPLGRDLRRGLCGHRCRISRRLLGGVHNVHGD